MLAQFRAVMTSPAVNLSACAYVIAALFVSRVVNANSVVGALLDISISIGAGVIGCALVLTNRP